MRKVTPSGNGAHIFAPKEWMNEEVMLVRISKLDIKKEILKVLETYMENVVSAILFGSYARGEQNEKSDVDVLVIANKSFKISKRGFNFIVISMNKIREAITLNPILMYSAIFEGISIVNSSYLEILNNERINKKTFKEFINSSKESLKSTKEIVELDKEQGLNYASDSAIYSLFMRLRGIFIISCLLENKRYSNSLFKNWILRNVSGLDYESFYSIYASLRDDKKPIEKISIKYAESLINLLNFEIRKKR